MELATLQLYLGKVIRFLFVALAFLFIVSLVELENTKKPPEERERIVRQTIAGVYGLADNENYPKPWPPAMNSTYPDYELIDQEGKQFKISDFKGKVIVMEMVDMSSPVSQSFSGAAKHGLFGTIDKFDEFSKPFDEMLSEYTDGQVVLPLSNVVTIKVIIHTQTDAQPLPSDAENWANFFRLSKADNVIVAVPVNDIRGMQTDTITPGFQLVDQEMLLRVDSAGPNPKHNLGLTLIPKVPDLIGR